MQILILCAAALVLLFALLSVNVSLVRLKMGKQPDTPELELKKAVRAHGNASEYIPLFLAVMFFFHMTGPTTLVIATAVVATVSRYAHAIGMFVAPSLNRPHPVRFVGALGTYIALFGFGVALLSRFMGWGL